MKFCSPDLNSRQQLQAINYNLLKLKDQLLELAVKLDIPLSANQHFYSAMSSLLDASLDISNLRAVASPIFLSDLENGRKEDDVVG